jgi:hypothetical protein
VRVALDLAHTLLVERRDDTLRASALLALAGVEDDVNPDSLDAVADALSPADPARRSRDRQAEIEAFLAATT